jgi:hypothetical protein
MFQSIRQSYTARTPGERMDRNMPQTEMKC